MGAIPIVLGSTSILGTTLMNAIASHPAESPYRDPAPVLVVASSEDAMARAERTIEASGVRVGPKLTVEMAGPRLERQAHAAALWVELDRDGGAPMNALLAQVCRDVRDGRYPAIV